VLFTHSRQVLSHWLAYRRRKDGNAILRALTPSYEDLVAVEVHVLHSKTKTLAQSQSRSIQHGRNETIDLCGDRAPSDLPGGASRRGS
jgi:predicted transcriptional regulator